MGETATARGRTDVGGKYDGVPTTATLYYVGGFWKVFYVETQS